MAPLIFRPGNIYLAVLCFAILFICTCVIILSLVPPISRDALVHHLAIPKLYLEYGGFFPLPCMSYSYYPMNLDLIYMVALYLGSDIAPKFIHFSFALMTAVLIYKYLKKRLNTSWGLWGVILFLSIPIIIKLSITVYVDLGLIFFSTAALLGILKWIETDFKVKYLLLSGIFCGLAMGTKYNGLIVFFLLTLFVPFIYSRFKNGTSNSQIKALGAGLIFGLMALIVFSPWMIRNYTWTRNPVYPLYNKFFDVQMNPSCPIRWKSENSNKIEKDKITFGRFAYRKFMYGEKWWETVSLPIRIFFQGKDNDFQFFDGKLSILLLLLPLFSFVPIAGSTDPYKYEKKILASFSILFIFFAIFGSVVRIRYLAPMIPCMRPSARAANMPGSSAFILSPRVKRTCATPLSPSSMETRSLNCMLKPLSATVRPLVPIGRAMSSCRVPAAARAVRRIAPRREWPRAGPPAGSRLADAFPPASSRRRPPAWPGAARHARRASWFRADARSATHRAAAGGG